MPITSFEIRLCTSCGLRYPLADNTSFGMRCPICMGSTRLLLTRQLSQEPKHHHPAATQRRMKNNPNPTAVLLDNIRSAWNVGSIFRSADGFGFSHAYLCGITPTPENEAVTKTALGAEDSVTWSYHKDAVKLIHGLKKESWKVSALEEDERSIPLRDKSLQATTSSNNQKRVLIVGNEITGVDPELLDLCDQIYYIPMRGEKKSFNVAMAFSIAAYQLQK